MSVKYKRTGEFRRPTEGEWYEGTPNGYPSRALGNDGSESWILTRMASPVESQPATEDVLRFLLATVSNYEPHTEQRAFLWGEAMRCLRAHRKATMWLSDLLATPRWDKNMTRIVVAEKVLAILNGDGQA